MIGRVVNGKRGEGVGGRGLSKTCVIETEPESRVLCISDGNLRIMESFHRKIRVFKPALVS